MRTAFIAGFLLLIVVVFCAGPALAATLPARGSHSLDSTRPILSEKAKFAPVKDEDLY